MAAVPVALTRCLLGFNRLATGKGHRASRARARGVVCKASFTNQVKAPSHLSPLAKTLFLQGSRSYVPPPPPLPDSEASPLVALDANTNCYGASPHAIQAAQAACFISSKYPNPKSLQQALAAHLGVSPEEVALGNGASELICLLLTTTVLPGEHVLYSPPSFIGYKLFAENLGVDVRETTTSGSKRLFLDEVLNAITQTTKIVFLDNPNNPSGTYFGRDGLLRFLDRVPEHVIVALDEAYGEYATAADFPNGVDVLRETSHHRLVVLRTFSKCYGLAAYRIGYAVGRPDLIAAVNAGSVPYSTNAPALSAALGAIADVGHVQLSSILNAEQRELLVRETRCRGLDVQDSQSNFLLVDFDYGAKEVYEGLLQEGVLTKKVPEYGLDTCLRITIGTGQENKLLLRALDRALKKRSTLSVLSSAAQKLQAGDQVNAVKVLNTLQQRDLNDLERTFTKALLLRACGSDQGGNLYLKKPGSGIDLKDGEGLDQISLFEVLATKVPLVTGVTEAVNQILIQLMAGADQVTLLDVGIGTGRQEVALLKSLHAAGCMPRDLEIVGIEPAESLHGARLNVLAAADELGVNVSFVACLKQAEDMTPQEWSAFERPNRRLIVFEGFSLHHVAGSPTFDAKQHVINQLRKLKPAAIVMAEPDSDHSTANLPARLHNAWRHYGAVFQVIDALALRQEVKQALKATFFGREVVDVVGTEDSRRTELHETGGMWRARLEAAGFETGPSMPVAIQESLVQLKEVVPGHYNLTHNDFSVVSILALLAPSLRSNPALTGLAKRQAAN